jgi:hypothetical protein
VYDAALVEQRRGLHTGKGTRLRRKLSNTPTCARPTAPPPDQLRDI